MNIDPVPLEKLLRAETISRSLHSLSREELEYYTSQLLTVTVKLTHQSKAMMQIIHEMELGLAPEG